MTDDYFKEGETTLADGGKTITQKTYTFYERDAENYLALDGQTIYKKEHYKDYTDLLINKNQAIMNPIKEKENVETNKYEIFLQGQNQIDIVGQVYSLTNLPVAEEIKSNFLRYGEH